MRSGSGRYFVPSAAASEKAMEAPSMEDAEEVEIWESIYDDAYAKKDACSYTSAEDLITNWSAESARAGSSSSSACSTLAVKAVLRNFWRIQECCTYFVVHDTACLDVPVIDAFRGPRTSAPTARSSGRAT